MQSITKTFLATSVAYLSHYGMIKLYNTMCVPDGFWGFIQGTIRTGSPVCAGMFGIMAQTHFVYTSIIITSLSHIFIDKFAEFMPNHSTYQKSSVYSSMPKEE